MALYETYIKQHRGRFTEELIQFCRQPSVASTGKGMPAMAALVAERLKSLGATTRTLAVGHSYPFIYAEIGSGPRTLLLYNHYDVQPARMEDGWSHPPFDPLVRDGRLYARGVADNKANLLFRIQALEAYLATRHTLPLRVRFLVEGEEEIGSPHLVSFVRQHHHLIQADGCIWESGRKGIEGRPLLQLGVRGMLYVELSLASGSREVHSGWANIIDNPALRLLERLQQAVHSLTDDEGRPTFGNLLDESFAPSHEDMAMLAAIPSDLDALQTNLGARLRPGLDAIEAQRRLYFEPTCNVCGMTVGYGGPGIKTIVPNRAVARLDFRLPLGLTPDHVEQQLRAHLHANGFGDIEVQRQGALNPSRTAPDAPIVQAVRQAVTTVYGTEPVLQPTMYASGPMFELCQSQNIPAVTFGAGHPGDNVHSVDENIVLDDYFQAMRGFGEIVRRFGEG